MNLSFLLAMGLTCLLSTIACAAPSKVEVKQLGEGHFQLQVDGKPFFIQGAGGNRSRAFLKEIGGNAIRTWGVDELGKSLDEAQQHGLKVCAGIWIEHERHGFSYNDPKFVASQFEKAKAAITKYKDHPALLLWAIGNEMEGEKGDNPRIWKAVNDIAKMAKEIDPNHPTMTVVAELGGEKVPALAKYCPDIDILGINSYAGAPSVPERYRKLGGTKPYVITEFGPHGTWEIPKNEWNVVQEPTSTVKAGMYRTSYEKAILGEKDKLCLGSFVFLWGNKQEATATWFGMFLADGSRTGAVDVMQEMWTGKPPANRVPVIDAFKVEANRIEPSGSVKAMLTTSDPENDALTAEWKLLAEARRYGAGGDHEEAPHEIEGAVTQGDLNGAAFKMPGEPGAYRLFVTVRDGNGGAATANVPLLVGNAPVVRREQLAPLAKLPLVIYGDGASPVFIPSGWMGKTDSIKMDPDSTESPKVGETCLKCAFDSTDNFGGVVWQSPADDWGDAPGGLDLSGASKLTFWARGKEGGERVEFKLGILGKEKKVFDTGSASKIVTLTPEWTAYEIDLTGLDLRRIKTPFVWVVEGRGKPTTFYLDEIRYVE